MVGLTGRSNSDPLIELHTSAKPVVVFLAVMGLVLTIVSDRVPSLPRLQVELLALLCYVLSGAGLLLDIRSPLASRWFTVAGLTVLVSLCNRWLGISGLLTLMSLPAALAAAMLGVSAAAVLALGQTALIILLRDQVAIGASPATIAVALTGIWTTVGVMVTVYHPINQSREWMHDYFARVQKLVEEAKDRKAELEQALASAAHANRQLGLANERMATLRLIAEDAQRTKAAFVARVSHEFRTPLNMIIGLIELMLGKPEIYAVALPPEMAEDLRVVHRNCKHLSGMINDVLDLTRVETGRVMLHKEHVDLTEIIDQAVATVRPLVEKKGLYLRVSVPDDLPAVYCDRTRIRQVVLNLVSNAARFTERGGIQVRAVARDGHVTVRVEDTGPGIAPEDTERIFEPFYQGNMGLWQDIGGSGLGLSISRQLIKLHHGRLWVESELGVGSSFIFELPVSPPAGHIARPERWIRRDWVWREEAFRTDRLGLADQPRRPRVVICDTTDSLLPDLERYGDEIDLVRVGDPSEVGRGLQECPADAVLLNLAAGDDLLAQVEEAGREAPGTPVIGCSIPAPVGRAWAAGAIGQLTKPVSVADLRKVLRSDGRPVKRVLVVDDDPDCLQLFARMLHVCDDALEVESATSGLEALDKLRRASFDLVLLDILMPDIDGWEVLERVGEDGEMGNPSVFLVSAQDPVDQPLRSRLLLATIDEGLSINKLLRCSLELSALLLTPDGALDPVPPQTAGAGPASTRSEQLPAKVPAPSL